MSSNAPARTGTPTPAEIVGASAPVIAAAFDEMPPGALVANRITFSYLRTGVAATVRADITVEELRKSFMSAISGAFARAGWAWGGWHRDATARSYTAVFRHPSTHTRTDIPAV
ncbi:hypothetical protein ACFC58_06185 [Kitasatospora purpeofusca]|uniref:hypothetical protein n=1 Tax=Kitasatospora purpeofusca TaxID=67352 RepID=UPI0035E0A448